MSASSSSLAVRRSLPLPTTFAHLGPARAPAQPHPPSPAYLRSALRRNPHESLSRVQARGDQRRVFARSAGSAPTKSAVGTTIVKSDDPNVQEMMEFLKDDLPHLFDDQGIDESKYGDVVDFQDPITKYDSLGGYLFNIKMLRFVFNPEFILHGLWQSGPNEITSRWTMNMELGFNKASPFRNIWDPKLTFTGLSIYTMDDVTGKIVKHIDYWDAINDQQFLSLEAVMHLASQISDLKRTPPDLGGPKYTILKKRADYEVRRYEPYLVAERPFTSDGTVPTAPERRGAFQALAKYIFGGNKSETKMAMTTPVLSDDKTMQFVIDGVAQEGDAPLPEDTDISIKRCEGGVLAALEFNGTATEELARLKQEELRGLLVRDGLVPGVGFVTARYNDPSVPDTFRRNEVLIPVERFKLLEVGEDS